jgi:CBS domain-containing protein
MTAANQNNSEEFVDPLSNYEPRTYRDELERVLAEETAGAIRSSPYSQVDSSTTVRRAVHALYGLQVSSLLVVEGDRLVGIFTERDVLEKVAERYSELADVPVRDVMTKDPIVVYEGDSVGTALAAIAAGGYRHVPVLNLDGQVLGVLSPRRVLGFLERHFEPSAA